MPNVKEDENKVEQKFNFWLKVKQNSFLFVFLSFPCNFDITVAMV